MPGIDYALVRQQVSLAQVLELVGGTTLTRHGAQVRGPCPLHGSTSARSRSWSGQLERGCWQCLRCGAHGNALELYLAVTRLRLYEGTLELCARLHLAVPWLATSRRPP